MIRIFRHYVPKSLIILGSGEILILLGSAYLGVTLRFVDFNPTDKLLVGALGPKAIFYAGLMMLCMAVMGLYQRALRDDLRGVLFRAGLALGLGLVAMTSIMPVFPELSLGTAAFTVTFALSAAGLMVFRVLVHEFAGTGLYKRRVMVLGAGKLASQVEQLRRKTDQQDMVLIGYVHVDGEEDVVDESKVLHINGSLVELVVERHVNEIVVAIDERRSSFPLDKILDCKMSGIRVIDLMRFFEEQTGKIKLDVLTPSHMIFADGFIQAVLKGFFHRVFDMILSVALLAVVWPVMLVSAVAILLESRGQGPVLYKQIRVGRDGCHFEVLKFRSMNIDAEKDGKAQWATSDDDRVTRVGSWLRKTRIDELPQLINVLKGDMSFVGPRPERPEFVAELGEKIPYYDLRHRVNPGITGWAQICYPYGSSERDAREKLQFDLYYIKNYSLFLDLMILIQTAQVMIWGKGAR